MQVNYITNGLAPVSMTSWMYNSVSAVDGKFVLSTPSYMYQEISTITPRPANITVMFLFKLDGAFNPLDLQVRVLIKVEVFYVDGTSDFFIFPVRQDAYDASTIQENGYSKVITTNVLSGTSDILKMRATVVNDSSYTVYIEEISVNSATVEVPYTDDIDVDVQKWLYLTYVTLEAANWVGQGIGGTAPYVQQIMLADVQSSDTPLVGPVFWDDLRIAIMQQIDWGLVNMVETFDGYAFFVCFKYKPVTTMLIQMKGV